jgi:hypothetical protein
MDKSLIIGIPSNDGKCNLQLAQGLTQLVLLCKANNIKMNVIYNYHCSLIHKGRSDMISNFLHFTNATHFMFIDSDLKFEPEAVINMLDIDVDLIGATYPKKIFNFDLIKHVIKENDNLDEYSINAITNEYALSFLDDFKNTGKIQMNEKGLIEVQRLPTGFLMMTRKMLLEMVEKYPEHRYKLKNVEHEYQKDKLEGYSLFDTYIDEDGDFISEDYAFCDRYREIGGKVWLYPHALINHIGAYEFKGDLMQKFQYGKR